MVFHSSSCFLLFLVKQARGGGGGVFVLDLIKKGWNYNKKLEHKMRIGVYGLKQSKFQNQNLGTKLGTLQKPWNKTWNINSPSLHSLTCPLI
jgi:hypothetical protein